MTPRGRHAPTDPVIRPAVQATLPVGRVRVDRGGVRQRAGIVVVAVLGLVVVAAGVGLDNRADQATASASPHASLVANASGHPQPSGPSAQPSEGEPVDCHLVGPGQMPEPYLTSTAFEAKRRLGVAVDDDVAATPVKWPVPDVADALELQQLASLAVVADGSPCIDAVTSEYFPVVPSWAGAAELRTRAGQSLNGKIILSSPPAGDWLVLVHVRYASGPTAATPPVVSRSYRVRVAMDDVANQVLVTPDVPCGATPADGHLPTLSIKAGGAAPVLGVDLATYPGDPLHVGAIVQATLEEPVVIQVEDDRCSTGWAYQWLDPTNAGGPGGNSQDNPNNSPYVVAQNRVHLEGNMIVGHTVLQASLQFGPGVVVRYAWEFDVPRPAVPDMVLAADGHEIQAVVGCGTSWSSASGSTYLGGYESCAVYGPPPNVELPLLQLRDGHTIAVATPGWSLDSWGASCGEADSVGGFNSRFSCDYGGSGGDANRFLPLPGRYLTWIWGSLSRDGQNVYATYYLDVEVTD